MAIKPTTKRINDGASTEKRYTRTATPMRATRTATPIGANKSYTKTKSKRKTN